MSEYGDPSKYWEQRLGASFDLRGSGYAALGPRFNAVLYAARLAALDRALHATGGPLTELRVLEVGCGTGFYTQLCRDQRVTAYTGADLTHASVNGLKLRYPDYEFVRAELGADSFQVNEQFDVVLVADVLFHIIDEQSFARALVQLARCVRPGGRLIVSDVLSVVSTRAAEHVSIRSRSRYDAALAIVRMRVAWVEPIFAVLQPPIRMPGTALAWQLYAWLWQHALLRVASQRWFDRTVPRRLSRLDARVFLPRAGLRTPNSKWLVAVAD